MRPDLTLLFDRPFWLDEWHAVLPASRPTLTAVIGDLQRGSDFAPPLLHVSLWLLRVLAGGTLTPTLARSFSAACVFGAVVLVFLALRRRFDLAPSLAGALACATHGIVVAYAFEARFYAPWLLCAAAFAWSLSIDGDAARSRRRDVAIAVSSIGLCTAHWFGSVTLGLMCIGALVALRHDWRAAVRRMLPAVAGGLALAACLPLLIGQRSAIVEKSWIETMSWYQFSSLIGVYWGSLVVLVAVLVIALAALRARDRLRALTTPALRDPSAAALLATAAMPLMLVVLSLLQPVLIGRYALTSVLAWAPLVALALQLLPRSLGIVAVVLLSGRILLSVGGQVGLERQVASIIARDRALLTQMCRAGPVVFVTRLQMYYHTDLLRERCPQAKYLVLPQRALDRLYFGPNEFAQPRFRTEAEFALLHTRLYGYPGTVTPAQLDSLPHFVVMAEPSSLPRDASGHEFFSRIVFPRHRATPLNGNGTLYERATAGRD
jgi:hypothetical protein